MKKYYAIYDNQINEIRGIAFNCQNKEIVRKELVNFLLLGNFSEEGEISIKNNSLEELLNYYEFSLLSSKDRLSENITNIEKFINVS